MDFELTNEKIGFDNKVLTRIRYIKDIRIDGMDIKKGTKGGFVERADNLGENGFVFDNAKVYGNAVVKNFSIVSGNAVVLDDAVVNYYSKVTDNAMVRGKANIFNFSNVSDNAYVGDNVKLIGGFVGGNAKASGNARIFGSLYGNADIDGLDGEIYISSDSWVFGNVQLSGNVSILGKSKIGGNMILCGNSIIEIENEIICNLRAYDARIYSEKDFHIFSNVEFGIKETIFFHKTEYGYNLIVNSGYKDNIYDSYYDLEEYYRYADSSFEALNVLGLIKNMIYNREEVF